MTSDLESIARRVRLGGRIVVLVGLLLAGTGCAGIIRSQVLDARTDQPIAGAVVLGVWTRVAGLPGLYHHELVGVRETVTDADGRFELKRLQSSGLDGEGGGQSITVYKFGYAAWNNLFVFPTWDRRRSSQVPKQIRLELFPPGMSRQRHMSFINTVRDAGTYGHESIPRFSEAVRSELRLP